MAKPTNAAVIGAILANFAIAAAKLLAGSLSASSGTLSEAVHSAVDGCNDILLLYGVKRSRRPPDEQHPFGHGKELYFWSLIVSCSVFAVGGCGAVLEGLHRILHPAPITHFAWALAALLCGAAFDLSSLSFSLLQFHRKNRGKRFWNAIDESKDPAILFVVFEDLVGALGEFIALAGITLQRHAWLRADGVAAVLIGLLLAASAVFLMTQNRDPIIGESVNDEVNRSIRNLATGKEKFLNIRQTHTMHFGPDTILLAIDGDFDPEQKAGDLMQSVDRIQNAIQQRYPAVKFIYVNPQPRPGK
ncbi:cation diffusion facilitator family transporter [Acidobacteria bacterium AB60]|nr:cation diffusion facilitator family transporter [Acidobacteria bacterium AB60]